MEKLTFDAATFEQIQGLIYPLISTLFDFDATDWIGDKSALFDVIGNLFEQVTELFYAVRDALIDGILTEDEISGIITEALDIPEAIAAIKARFIAPTEGV